MAKVELALPSNVGQGLYVDSSCIDCDTCRQIAPQTFGDVNGQSYVHAQPTTGGSRLRAAMALVACPTASIGTTGDLPELSAARMAFPELVTPEVAYCGYSAPSSYGASSYLLLRPQGNVLVDCPRFAAPLRKRIEEMGGIDLIVLTHRDDVADHAKWARHFGARRVLHHDDVTEETAEVEVQPQGSDPLGLDDELLMIPTPGHTEGHAVFLYRGMYLFTGDHLWHDRRLDASRSVCWYDWKKQQESMKRLLTYDFDWVLPGHGGRHHAPPAAMRTALQECIARMATQR